MKETFGGANLEDQTILADHENFGNVILCPGGVIHINLTHLSLKFLPDDFVKFSELIEKARRQYKPPGLTNEKPRLHLVGPTIVEDDNPNPTE